MDLGPSRCETCGEFPCECPSFMKVPERKLLSQEEAILRAADDMVDADPVLQMEQFRNDQAAKPSHNGKWWRLRSWRESIPENYCVVPCDACRNPVAKPVSIARPVMCEHCEPQDGAL